MCGIAGFTGLPNDKVLKRMADTLIHRGPDDEAYYQDANCSLTIRRLSIIDLTPGIYPMRNERGDIVCVFNGEIYNFKDIRQKLKKNHQFKTNCDAEVIVHGYEEWGGRILDHLNGMFAIALWDRKNKRLFLARDRLGKKPLYWTMVDGRLVFGSEIKAILVHPSVRKELDFDSLNKYLVYEYVPAPLTMLNGIYKLESGNYLIFAEERVRIKKYWEVTFQCQMPDARCQMDDKKLPIANYQLPLLKSNEKEAVRELDWRLEQAVKLRLTSDVPLGVFLSGGIDSATIAYYMAKHTPGKVKSFSIAFDEQSFDESRFARMAAATLGTDHHEQLLDLKKTIEIIPELYSQLDEPLADAALIPNYLLSKFARQHVTVALGGDGGDELFMGYPTYQAHKLALIYQIIPKAIRKYIIESIVNNLPTSFANFSFDFKAKKFVTGFDYPPEVRNQVWLGHDPRTFNEKLLLPKVKKQMRGDVFEDVARYNDSVNNETIWAKIIYLYLKTYLQDDILTLKDRASMYVSLEVRSPFLDYQVVDFVNSLPVSLKLRGWKTKYILKKLMKGRLPDVIINRGKKGFGIPLSLWLTRELKELMLDLLSQKKIKRDGLFHYPFIKKLIDDHMAKRSDNRKQLWTLLCFQLWRERWMGK